ncbi:uncharacterized protein LOC124498613 [Dermatophagoides farinae]|uniref:Uncharacterized protein n=1 Tax=Dermatophagoides farinae TaxID=6954 RepID=A0A922ID59_DERFA|nr:uncharacterized protein LOC124498613 [Dermatophagoides farinae]XP_046918357.1 uncharacterized protein LOC124498613 [Dermatophagoides farinae]KAH7636555.1 hypothetical protein HUG17_10525 [Dermatophagoides farinae]KAH9528643.1 hypothetical protein DERF_002565 [Dermatophagoides farinae]
MNNMRVVFLFATTVISLVLFIVLVMQGAPWNNIQIFFLSVIIIILIASLVGFIFAAIRNYCWTTTISYSNPTPTTLYTNPPPIGSAEAEFQNEYIPVFPMRQLQPRVDLDKPY